MTGTQPPASLQAVVFAALFSAAVSLTETTASNLYGVPKSSLVERLQSSTEISLSRANFLRTTKLHTMQAFVMYLVGSLHATRECYSTYTIRYRYVDQKSLAHIQR